MGDAQSTREGQLRCYKKFIATYEEVAPHPYFPAKVGGKVTYKKLKKSRLGGRLREFVRCLKNDQNNTEVHRSVSRTQSERHRFTSRQV